MKPKPKKLSYLRQQEELIMAEFEELEVAVEVEAVQAVYGDDCVVLDSKPPHLHVRIKPRTADVTSEQFVEAIIGIRANSQYPKEPPRIDLVDSMGLDEKRQMLLFSCIRDKAVELSNCLMLVALCEEAVEKLSLMNHPDGDCPLCLDPLVPDDEQKKGFPFMKLMSCFHCFHSECIVRWWNWLQKEQKTNSTEVLHSNVRPMMGSQKEESIGNCPICRKVFHTKDFKHVIDLVGNHSSSLVLDENEESEKLLHSEMENNRRQKFEAVLKLQQDNSGLFEPKKYTVVQPGMHLPQPVAVETEESNNQQRRENPPISKVHAGASSERPNTTEPRFPGSRKQKAGNFKKPGKQPVKQWIKKENGPAS